MEILDSSGESRQLSESGRLKRRGATIAWIVSVAFWTLAPCPSLANPVCDPVLKTDPADPLAYRLREDRCEGLFVQQVSGSIRVASLHFAPRTFSLGVGQSVRLSWSFSLDRPNRLRAVSLKPKVYYRMDTLRPAESTSYGWPTDLLEQLGVSDNEIGLVSWQDTEIAGSETRLYSPVSVEGSSEALEIVLLPDLALEEVYLSLAPIDDNGRAGEYLLSDMPLEYNVYPEGRPVTVQLPSLEKPGVYRLEIGTLFRTGGSSSQDVLFYLNYAQIHFASVAAFVAGWRSS